MPEGARINLNGMKVLGAFMDNPRLELSGADIARGTHLLSGTLYPLMIRFEKAGLLKSRWEKEEASELGRPRRRLYKITGIGQTTYRRHLTEVVPVRGMVWT